MISGIQLEKILFLDIETVSEYSAFEEMNGDMQKLWEQKGGYFARREDLEWNDEVAAEMYGNKAAIFAEFGKVVVISVGYVRSDGDSYELTLKSFAGHDEKELLKEFSKLLTGHYNNPNKFYLCGHNIKEFDIPYLCRRLIIHSLPLPDIINVTGKKPWETAHLLDTMNLWKFGDYKHFTSLNLLAHILGIPTPKDDIDGSEVGRVYWKEKDLDRIVTYCEKDVATCVRVLLRLMGKPPLAEDGIRSVTSQ